MTKSQIEIGKVYAAKVSGKIAPVVITGISQYGGWNARSKATGREIRIRSAAKLRYEMVQRNGVWTKWLPIRCQACENCKAVIARKPAVQSDLVGRTLEDGRPIRSEWAQFLHDHPCTNPVSL